MSISIQILNGNIARLKNHSKSELILINDSKFKWIKWPFKFWIVWKFSFKFWMVISQEWKVIQNLNWHWFMIQNCEWIKDSFKIWTVCQYWFKFWIASWKSIQIWISNFGSFILWIECHVLQRCKACGGSKNFFELDFIQIWMRVHSNLNR